MTKRRVYRESVIQPPDPSYRIIPLTKGQVALVSARVYAEFSQYPWGAQWNSHTQSFYAMRRDPETRAKIWMHREILGLTRKDPRQGDHENHDTLDNRDENLRIATRSQQNINKRRPVNNISRYKGVSVFGNGWRVTICVNKTKIHIGLFAKDSLLDAARAYDAAALKYFGEFAHLNFPKETYEKLP